MHAGEPHDGHFEWEVIDDFLEEVGLGCLGELMRTGWGHFARTNEGAFSRAVLYGVSLERDSKIYRAIFGKSELSPRLRW